MPRKVQQRWGETGVRMTFTLSDMRVAELGTHLGVTDANVVGQLKANLEWIGARYLLWVQHDEKGPSRAEQNAAFKKLLACPQNLEFIVAGLDHATAARLLDELWTHPDTKPGGRLLDEVAKDNPNLLFDCARRALKKGQRQRGPAPCKTLPIIIRWLASLYEETTGRAFTHTPYEKTKYTSVPQSHAGRFVSMFLMMVDEDLPTIATPIATEMARIVRERRRKVLKTSPGDPVQTI